MGVPCGSSPTISWLPRLTYSNLVFPAQDSVSPFAKTRITKLQRNKYIHPGCFQEETAQNREGGVLLGKLLTASRMIKKKTMPSSESHFRPGPQAALGPRATPAGHTQFPGTARLPGPAKATAGRKSFPARAPQLSPTFKRHLAPATCAFWKASMVQWDQVCARIWAGFY